MRRVLKHLILLYPKAWRNRYQGEFEALLDDVPPGWRSLFDVVGGALKMQWKMSSAWKIVGAFAIVGVLGATAYSLAMPDRYVSTAVIHMGKEVGPAQLETVLSRASLTRLINQANLYPNERTYLPIEDLVEMMRHRDIMIRPNGPDGYMVSFTASNAKQARQGTEWLAWAFHDGKTWSMVDPPSVPIYPSGPRRSRMVVMGLVCGILVGALFASFHGLRVWKLAAALGIAGAMLFLVSSYFVPDRYSSVAVVRYHSPEGAAAAEARMRQVIEAATSNTKMDAVVHMFGIYRDDPQAARTLREHLHIDPWVGHTALLIKFDYTNRYMAQRVTQHIVDKMMVENEKASTGLVIEELDGASLPLNPYFPNRLNVAGVGLVLGLMAAVGVRVRNRSVSVAAAG